MSPQDGAAGTASPSQGDPLAVRAVLVVPFRDRGHDPRRSANLDAVRRWWDGSPWPLLVVDDGRTGDAQFNRSAAYNRGAEAARATGAEVIIYTEADMLIPWAQIARAVRAAAERPGLVVPFSEYRYLVDADSITTRQTLRPHEAVPESVMSGSTSMGAVNVISLTSLDAVGAWDEAFEGNWYDDNAMERAFAICCGPRRHIAGPAWHLFHLPGWAGEHLTDADRAATAANHARWERYLAASTPQQIRALTTEKTGSKPVKHFDTTQGCLDHALNLLTADEPVLALEFGVSTGNTLRQIVTAMPEGSRVVGFDSFEGLPEHWRDGFPAGMFRATPPEIPGAELVIGLYAKTLPTWAPDKDDPEIALVHIDCDLYTSTRDVLTHLGPHLKPGCLIVFDEFHGYPGYEDHEARAWDEWTEAEGATWTLLAKGPEQALIRLEKS